MKLGFVMIGFLSTSLGYASNTVQCTGEGPAGHDYSITLQKDGEELAVIVEQDEDVILNGKLQAYQQSLAVDPISHQKYELTQYWNPAKDVIRLSLKDENLSTARLIFPEELTLICN